MAPALPLAPSNEPETLDVSDKRSHPQRPLTPGNNSAPPMDEDVMSLQKKQSLVKDSQEMEKILIDLARCDRINTFMFQAMKTFDSTGDNISTMGDPDPFLLPDFDLQVATEPEVVSETVADEANIKVAQARLERRCAFLQRRLRILQTRAIGKRISEEVVMTFDKCTRGARKDGGGRPIGLKAFIKRIETTAALQASAASHREDKPTYYHAGTSKDTTSRSASMGIAPGTLSGLEDTAGALRSHLAMVNNQLDSDATASSSGAESNDEAVAYNNQHQQQMPIEKRALWTWQRARASIASRWCWLLAQIQELEYKIRQHCELHEQVREVKGAVQFEGEPPSYDWCLPGVEELVDSPATETCARVRPLRRETFKKRKLLQMHNLHIATRKAAKPSDIGCSCQYPRESCPVCTGRAEPTQPTPSLSGVSCAQRVALLDPGYHPVLSDIRDVSPAVHIAAITKRTWFRARSAPRPVRGAHHTSAPRTATHHHQHQHHHHHQQQAASTTPPSSKRHAKRLKRGRPPLSRKTRERDRDEDTSTSGHDRVRIRTSTSTSTETRNRRNSYDIDNIVIPQSVAASTRPQILPYKEIITPKWRVLELTETPLNNGVSKSNRMSMESEEEDVSEAAVAARHTRAERLERSRFTRNTRRRTQHLLQQEDLFAPPSPPPPPPEEPQQREDHQTETYHHHHHHQHNDHDSQQQEIVRPYTPRQFPLPDDIYTGMIAAMPDGFRQSSPEPVRTPPPPHLPPPPLDERSSTLSPMSPLIFEGDDPDDIEWEPSSEKCERRKSTLR